MLETSDIAPKPKSETKLTGAIRRRLVPFFAGVVVAAPITVVAVLGLVNSQPAKIIQVKTAATSADFSPAELANICGPVSAAGPVGGLGGGQVLGESITAPVGGQGGGLQPGGNPAVVQQLVSINNTGTISNTGPSSTNAITFTNNNTMTVTNTNDLTFTNENIQTATSGAATVSTNTSGGAATTGTAQNDNSNSVVFSVTN